MDKSVHVITNFDHLEGGLKIDYMPVTSLKPYKDNPRRHSKKQIQQIANSIVTFGFTNPILVDKKYSIIAGHGRVEAGAVPRNGGSPHNSVGTYE